MEVLGMNLVLSHRNQWGVSEGLDFGCSDITCVCVFLICRLHGILGKKDQLFQLIKFYTTSLTL